MRYRLLAHRWIDYTAIVEADDPAEACLRANDGLDWQMDRYAAASPGDDDYIVDAVEPVDDDEDDGEEREP